MKFEKYLNEKRLRFNKISIDNKKFNKQIKLLKKLKDKSEDEEIILDNIEFLLNAKKNNKEAFAFFIDNLNEAIKIALEKIKINEYDEIKTVIDFLKFRKFPVKLSDFFPLNIYTDDKTFKVNIFE